MDHSHEDHLFEDQIPFEDRQQNFWQLAAIQSAAFGMPTLVLGQYLATSFGRGAAVLSICIGNLILWLIGLGTIAMAYNERKNAIQNLRVYIGSFGSILGGLFLLGAFLLWYSLQIWYTLSEAKASFEDAFINSGDFELRLGVVLGLGIALASLGGIRFIKWFSVIVFPLLFVFVVYALFKNPLHPNFNGRWYFSIPAIGLVMSSTLPGMVNLPTFFRHGRSRPDIFLALTIFTIFTTFFQFAGVFLAQEIEKQNGVFVFLSTDLINGCLLAAFLLMSLISVNIVNIYFASAAWEAIVPKIRGNKKLAIVGMAGTVGFTFFQIRFPMLFLENVLDGFLGSMGAVLLMVFMVRRIVSHRERWYEHFLSVGCWVTGCIVAVIVQSNTSLESSVAFFSGIAASCLAFLLVIFFEETGWSIKYSLKKSKELNF